MTPSLLVEKTETMTCADAKNDMRLELSELIREAERPWRRTARADRSSRVRAQAGLGAGSCTAPLRPGRHRHVRLVTGDAWPQCLASDARARAPRLRARHLYIGRNLAPTSGFSYRLRSAELLRFYGIALHRSLSRQAAKRPRVSMGLLQSSLRISCKHSLSSA